MRSRLSSPLRIVILLFAGAAASIVFVAVYQARRGPFMRQEMARAEEVRRVLQEARVDPIASDDDDDEEAGDVSSLPKGLTQGDSLAGALYAFSKQTYFRYPRCGSLTYAPEGFPENLTENLKNQIVSNRAFMEAEKHAFDDYIDGKPNATSLSESQRAKAVAARKKQLAAYRSTSEASEAFLARIKSDPDGVWIELLDYFESAGVLRDVEERLRSSPDTLPIEALGAAGWFACRAVLEIHAARYDAALVSFGIACDLESKTYSNKRYARGMYFGASARLDGGALRYFVSRAELSAAQRGTLLNALSRRANPARASEQLHILAAKVEEQLDQAEMAQLKLDSAKATVYRSPFELADRIAAGLEESPDRGMQVLKDARNDLRAISAAAYAASSPSLFGPKGRVSRYLGYLGNLGAEAESAQAKPPTIMSTVKFVEDAVSPVEDYMRVGLMVEVTRTAFALKDYKAAHGHYPDALKDLTPDLLATVPIVPWTGERIAYVSPNPEARGGYVLGLGPFVNPEASDTLWRAGE